MCAELAHCPSESQWPSPDNTKFSAFVKCGSKKADNHAFYTIRNIIAYHYFGVEIGDKWTRILSLVSEICAG